MRTEYNGLYKYTVLLPCAIERDCYAAAELLSPLLKLFSISTGARTFPPKCDWFALI